MARRREGEAAAADGLPLGVRALSRGEFSSFQELILREAGIFLSDAKQALLVGRLSKRLRDLGLRSFREYYELVRGDAQERVRMLDAVSTNETHFFREPRQFEFLERQLVPAWLAAAEQGLRPKRVRVWSAACSTGEEPYSLGMLLLTQLPPAKGWQLEIVASDLSTRALDRARTAVWPMAKTAEIPDGCLRRFMLRGYGPQEGRMRAGPELRALVRFERVNLNDESYPLQGPFDLVFCRNVLIYFRPDTKARVLERLSAALAADGHLFLGHSESIMGLGVPLVSAGPNVYRRPCALARRSGAD